MPATLSIQSGADQQESVYSQSEKCDSPGSVLDYGSEATIKSPQLPQSGNASVVDNQSGLTLSGDGPRVKFESPKGADASSRPASSAAASQELDLEAYTRKPEVDEWKPQKREWFIMISLSLISFMVALDATILVTVLPEISHALHGSSIDAFWAGTSYLLTSAVFQPVIASVSQYFGRQQALIFSLFFFTLGTVLCAVADGFPLMLGGRSIQGVGGGGIITMNQVIFCDIVPLRQRPKYFAISLGAWAIGSILGPVVGGALCETTTWRWVFYINFPFCGLGFLLAFVFVRLNAVKELTLAQKLKKTDWFGAFLFVGGMTSFLVGLSWGGIQYPWRSAETLVPITVGLLAVGAFVGWQLHKKENSLLPMRIFSNRSALAAFYCALVNGLVLFSALYYFPFYSMAIRNNSPTRAGVETLPGLAFLVPGSIVVASITTRIGRFRWAVWGGCVVATLGIGLFIMFDEHTKFAVIATALAIFGIGAGMMITSVNVAIQAISKAEDNAMAASMYGFMRSLGMPIGVAISGTLFQNQMSSKLSDFGLPTSIAYDSERYMFELRAMAPEDPMRINVAASYVHGYRSVWILVTAISASAMLVSLLIKKYGMNKALQSRYSVRDVRELRASS